MKKIEKPQKEDLINYYITEGHSIKECANFFHIGETTFVRWLKYYNISKPMKDRVMTFKSSCVKKYGVDNPNKVKNIRDQIEQTNIKKYGHKTCLQNLDIKTKIKQTCIQKYGVPCILSSPNFRAKIIQTNIKKYGVSCTLQNDDIHQKVVASLLNKYGVEHPSQSSEIQEAIKKHNQEKYGSNYPQQSHIQHFDIWNNHQKLKDMLLSKPQQYNLLELSKFFNVDDTAVSKKLYAEKLIDYINLYEYRSYYEDEIIEWLKHKCGITNIIKNDRTVLDGQEIDIYLPDYRLGIEFNGDYWHCDIQDHLKDHNGRSLYHQKKSLLAESKGIFLFHIFEHEWSENFTSVNLKFTNAKECIKKRLITLLNKNEVKIPARKCSVVLLSKKEKKNFLRINHLQGDDHSKFAIGLIYNKEIISCMTFGKSKYKQYNWELSRFCNEQGVTVQGGASKLFKYFINHYLKDNENIVSYNDITKTKGDLYKILGFENIHISSPNYWWINFKTFDIRSRYQEQAAGEVDRMHSQGYHRICDCGTKTWVYTKKR